VIDSGVLGLSVVPFPVRERKSVDELDREHRLAVSDFAQKWPGCGIDDMRRCVETYDRWRAAFFNEAGNI
jgi:hypothetical protein